MLTNKDRVWRRLGFGLAVGLGCVGVLAGLYAALVPGLRQEPERTADEALHEGAAIIHSFFSPELRARSGALAAGGGEPGTRRGQDGGAGKLAPQEAQGAMGRGLASSGLVNPIRVGPWQLEDRPGFSLANLQVFMERFVREPHPMGSEANRRLARDMVFLLKAFGWKTSLLPFSQTGPNLKSPRFGGNEVLSQPETTVSGENVLAFRPGAEECVVVLGGHYDTKRVDAFRFVGANDGGSSTVLLLELARLIPKVWPGPSARRGASVATVAPSSGAAQQANVRGTWRGCGLALVFFDGEEALLPGWYDGLAKAGIEDHLYGSRDFVRQLEEGKLPWKSDNTALAMVIDMIGHRKQKLFITEGSDEDVAAALEAQRGEVDLRRAPFRVDDDHIPFLRRGIRAVHIIDWTNLEEWHKATDTPEIIGYDKIALFGDVIMRFLQTPRSGVLARREP